MGLMSNFSILNDAKDAYPAMILCINQAKKSIYFANFCVRRGAAFDMFLRPLMNAAERGVAVKILMDGYGSKDTDPNQVEMMRAAGIEAVYYRPHIDVRFWRYNKRLHKKILVIDENIGFTGGIGVADWWIKPTSYPKAWRDVHFEVTGKAVAAMVASFTASWNPWGGEQVISPKTQLEAGIEAISSEENHSRLRPSGVRLLQLINGAEHSITIMSGYFGPPKIIREALIRKARSGVRIEILTNGPWSTSQPAVASGHHLQLAMIKAGIRIYEYQPTKMHAKLMVFDNKTVYLGSTNLNMRSMSHDEELNFVVESDDLSHKITSIYKKELKNACENTEMIWNQRSAKTQIQDALFSLGRYYF